MLLPQRQINTRACGFTLIEQLLTIVLVLLLLGAAVYNFSSFNRSARLDEGATQVEALFRFARAHAASTGKQVRIEFAETATTTDPAPSETPAANVRVTWEPNPIGAPGVFQDLPDAANYVQSINDLVSVQEVRLNNTPSDAAAPAAEPTAQTTPGDATAPADDVTRSPMPAVTFYPDGTGDSVQLVLSSLNEEDVRRFSVRVVGLTGAIRRQLVGDPTANETAPPAPATEAAAEVAK